MKLLLIFIALNIFNVIIQTAKSIVTIKCGKVAASLVNAIAYGLYTVVLVYMNCDLSLWAKVLVVGGANLIGVYVVKLFEEKSRKDKLWKIEFTTKEKAEIEELLDSIKVSYNSIEVQNGYTIFNVFAETQKDSKTIGQILRKFDCKYFVSENKSYLN